MTVAANGGPPGRRLFVLANVQGWGSVSMRATLRKISDDWWRKARYRAVWWIPAIVVYYWALKSIGFSVVELVEGIPGLVALVSRMLPPDPGVLPEAVGPILETLQMAVVATSVAGILALPLGFLGARNINGNRALYTIVRFLLDSMRAIPELVFALIFVAAVGLGPVPGVMAIVLHSIGYLGKMYSEVIENIDPKPVEAVRATGASTLQVIVFAVLPQALPVMLSYVIYNGEVNVRSAAVLGMVGAGGIGFELQQHMRLFQYRAAVTIIILILVIVRVIDQISAAIRSRLV